MKKNKVEQAKKDQKILIVGSSGKVVKIVLYLKGYGYEKIDTFSDGYKALAKNSKKLREYDLIIALNGEYANLYDDLKNDIAFMDKPLHLFVVKQEPYELMEYVFSRTGTEVNRDLMDMKYFRKKAVYLMVGVAMNKHMTMIDPDFPNVEAINRQSAAIDIAKKKMLEVDARRYREVMLIDYILYLAEEYLQNPRPNNSNLNVTRDNNKITIELQKENNSVMAISFMRGWTDGIYLAEPFIITSSDGRENTRAYYSDIYSEPTNVEKAAIIDIYVKMQELFFQHRKDNELIKRPLNN